MGKGSAKYFDEIIKPWDENVLKLGMTTTPERPQFQRSEAHPWSSSPAYAFFHVLCGISPASEGYKTMRIAPDFGNNTFIEANYIHKLGLVKMKISKSKQNGIKGEIEIPDNLNAFFEWNGQKITLKSGVNKIEY